ncbi:hypothetical protein [Falsiroseomonas sp. CW058]|uniref:hypothetical protein n=1 Tax=Falsiroseomonas sp. CW058 TaxID=3388664 RepID=UPI003D311C7A
MPLAQDSLGRIAQVFSFGTMRSVAIGASSTQSAVLTAGASIIRLVSTSDCWVVIGVGADASSGGFFLPAGIVEYVGVPSGPVCVATRRHSVDGTLSIVEVS